jgi:hypothetical protein
MLNVIMLSVDLLNVIMLGVDLLNVIMLGVVMLNVVAPNSFIYGRCYKTFWTKFTLLSCKLECSPLASDG